MNKSRLSALEEELLAGNATVAFVGALLWAQSWKPSDGIYELPFTNLTIPAFHDAVYLAIGTLLFVLSIAFAVASVMPPIRSRAIRASRPFSGLLASFVWIAFTLGLLGAMAELPSDRWWTTALFLGGLTLVIFLGYRLIRAWYLSLLPTEDESSSTGSE